MKKITLIIALLSAVCFYGQKKVPAHVQELVASKASFRQFSPLTVGSGANSANIAKAVDNATLATINAAVVKDIATHKYNTIEIAIPYNGSTIAIQLYRVEVLAKGFHADTDKQANIQYNAGAYYRGIIKGNTNSIASFNFFDKEMNGIVSASSINNLVVGRLQTAGNFSNYIVYSDAQLNITNTFDCGVTEQSLPVYHHNGGKSALDTQSEHCVTIYFEMDYELYLENGEDTTIASNWMTSVFNNAQTLYANDGITTALKSVYIWTEQDPYSGDSSDDYLYEFSELRPIFDGDLGQLLGIDDGGLGGVAIDIAGICSDNNVSYGDIDFEYESVPLFSWTIEVVTHELGHLMGSPHTHGCYWNGNNTAIDGCGTLAGYIEGDCDLGPLPSAEEQGTIMSYCHLLGGIGINFANGFGPQPAQRILDHVESSACLSTDCINTCINTVTAFAVMDTGMTTATIHWTDESSGPWEVGYALQTGQVNNWTETTENSFTVTGLNPNSYYKFRVRPICNNGVTAPEYQQVIVGTAADWCSGAVFTDTGGATGNYSNNQNVIRVIKPEDPQQQLVVEFTAFNIEEEYDYMYVYDGPDTNAPLLGTFTGTNSPGTLQSTAADGSLTFRFTSDGGVTASGWKANVSCLLATANNTFSQLQYYPNPASSGVTITSPEGITGISIYSVTGQLLLQKTVSGTTADTDIAAFANGVYFFKVTNGTKEANFRIVKQ